MAQIPSREILKESKYYLSQHEGLTDQNRATLAKSIELKNFLFYLADREPQIMRKKLHDAFKKCEVASADAQDQSSRKRLCENPDEDGGQSKRVRSGVEGGDDPEDTSQAGEDSRGVGGLFKF